MVKCPVCDSEATPYVTSEGERGYVCYHCGSRWKETKPAKKTSTLSFLGFAGKKGEESQTGIFSTSILLRFLIFLAALIVSSMLVLFSLLGMIQKEIAKLFPDFPTLQYLPYVVFFLLTAYAAHKLAKKSFVSGLIYCFILIIILILGSALIIELPKIFPGWANQTIIPSDNKDTIPQAIKEGGYYTFNFKWGSEETEFEKKFPRPFRKDSETIYTYSFPVTIENPSRKKSIKDFYFLETTGLYNTSDMLFHKLYPNLCTEDKKCEIAPLDNLLITLDSKGEISYKFNTIRIKVYTSLSSASFGNNTFVFVRSLDDEKIAPTYKPYTGEGPIDITVYFAPVRYNFGYMTDEKIRVFIQLRNRGDGTGKISKIYLTRIGSLELLEKPQTCEGVGGEYPLSSLDERNEYFEFVSPWTLASSPLVFFCDYSIPEKIRTEKISSPFETVAFVVSVEYTYERMHEKEVRAMVPT
ncbi:MAG: hypothetical protein QXE97_02020 [Candidatus Aenigmatarchaeota archaeon]